MLILIEKDSATRVPREVADIDAALAIQAQGFAVFTVAEDGSTTLLVAPVTDAEPEPAEEAPPKKSKKG